MKTRASASGPRLRAGLETMLQLGGLIGLWWVCEVVVHRLGIPVPGGVLGFGVLLALLATGTLPARLLARGAGRLLDHLLLFFVPASVTVLNHKELLGLTGLKVLAVIVVGIGAVMAGTALVVDWHCRTRERHVRG
jgi:holin-like protein